MLALLLGACGGSGGAEGEQEGGPAARRAQLRERLRVELGERYDEPLPELTDAQLARGEEQWRKHCTNCHGVEGRGDGTLSRMLAAEPGDLSDPERAAFFSERAKLWILAEGSPGTPMAAWNAVLDEPDMEALVAYMATLVVDDG